MLTIVDMTRAHLPSLVGIEKACFSHPWTYDGFAAELDNKTANFLVAEIDGKAVGYIGFYAVIDEGYTANVAVLPEFRRMGVADALLTAAEQRCRELGLAFLSLEVRCSNDAAIALYKKHGFEHVGTRRRFYTAPTEDALIMTRYFITTATK